MGADIGKRPAEFTIGLDAVAHHAVDDFGDLRFDRIFGGDVFDPSEHQGAETNVVDRFFDLVGGRYGKGVGEHDGERTHLAADLAQIGVDETQGAQLLFGGAQIVIAILYTTAITEEGPVEIDRFVTTGGAVGGSIAAVNGHGVVEINGDAVFLIDFVARMLHRVCGIVDDLEITLKGDSGRDALFAFAGEEEQRQEKEQELFHERCDLMWVSDECRCAV